MINEFNASINGELNYTPILLLDFQPDQRRASNRKKNPEYRLFGIFYSVMLHNSYPSGVERETRKKVKFQEDG